MTYDPNQRFGRAPVSVAPSPALSGTSVVVDVRTADPFLNTAKPFYLLARPANLRESDQNAEVLRADASVAGTRAGEVAIVVLQDGAPGAGSVQILTTQLADAGASEKQQVTVSGDAGTYALSFRGVATGTIGFGAASGTVAAALNGLSSISAFADVDIAEVVAGGNGVNARQSVVVVATGGTYTLTFGNDTTGALAWNANDAAIQTALEGLASIGTGNVVVSGGVATFQGDLAGVEVPLLVAAIGSLTGTGSVTVAGVAGGPYTITFGGGLMANRNVDQLASDTTLLTNSANSQNERVLITPKGDAGAYTLTLGANTTAAIQFNDTAGTVDTRLEALGSIGAGNVAVTGSAGGPYTVEFVGGKSGTNMGAITATVTTMTINIRTFTVARAVKGSTARAIIVGDTLEVTNVPDKNVVAVTVSADQNDWNPAGLAPDAVVLITMAGVATQITGQTGGADGRSVTYINVSPTRSLTLPLESTSSAAANRFTWDDRLSAVVLNPGDSITFRYDATGARWRALDANVLKDGSDASALVRAGSGTPALLLRNVVNGITELSGLELRDSAGTTVFTAGLNTVFTLTPAAGDNSTKVATTAYVDRGGGTDRAFAFFLGG